MTLAQLFLQLGIAGALLYVVYRLGDKMLDNQAAAEKRTLAVHAAAEVKRTKAIGEGFAAITKRLDDQGEQLTELTTKVDEAISTKDAIRAALEEVTGQHEIPVADQELEFAPPKPLARVSTGKTPASGVPAGVYSHVKRSGSKGGG